MTARRGTVAREPTPEPRAAAAIAELKTLIGGQREATGDLRERVKVLESESKHYATKADLANVKVWAMSGVVAALLSLLVALGVAFVRLTVGP